MEDLPKEKTMSEAEQIEEILEEANAYGLRGEVEMFAELSLEEDPLLSKLQAYVNAYHEWIK